MHWGKKIIVVYTLFVGGIMFMVIKSFHQNFDLVNDDYYAEELKFQNQIDATKNAAAFADSIAVQANDQQVELKMPETFSGNAKGTVYFYKPSDAKEDVKVDLNLDPNGIQQFDKKLFAKGFYTVKINWKKNNTSYYTEKNIMM